MRDQGFWDNIAVRYDQLYHSEYSRLEDQYVGRRLAAFLPISARRVLEIGCGTGLSLEICPALDNIEYLGIDVSEGMVATARQKSNKNFLCLSALDLDKIDGEFDFVFAINGVCSYLEDIEVVMDKIRVKMRTGGRCHLSFLGRYSIARLLRGELGKVEYLKIRGSALEDRKSFQYMYTQSDVVKLAKKSGFKVIDLDTYGLFSGWLETGWAFRIGETRWFRRIPGAYNISITLEVEK